MHEPTQRRITRTLSVLGVLMIGWRILAGAGHFGIGATGGPNAITIGLNTALGMMGLLFIGCGLTAWLRLRTHAAALFGLYGLFYGMHWGGLVPASSQWLTNTFSLLHLVLSGVLSQAFLLHFSLVYPRTSPILDSRPSLYVLYTPAAVAVVVMLVAILLQGNAALFVELEGWLQTFETVFTNGYFLLAALVIWRTWWRTDKESRDESSLNVIALGLLVAIIPYVTSVIVNALALVPWVYRFGAVPYTLFFSLIPVTFLIAILSNKLR